MLQCNDFVKAQDLMVLLNCFFFLLESGDLSIFVKCSAFHCGHGVIRHPVTGELRSGTPLFIYCGCIHQLHHPLTLLVMLSCLNTHSIFLCISMKPTPIYTFTPFLLSSPCSCLSSTPAQYWSSPSSTSLF